MTQTVQASRGGEVFALGTPASSGGFASSQLTLDDSVASSIIVTLRATAGNGTGTDSGANGADGGNANILGSISSKGSVTLTGTLIAGSGASAFGDGYGGNGGTGTFTQMYGRSTEGKSVSVSASLTGGNGNTNHADGEIFNRGGRGADAVLIDVVDGFTTGNMSFTQMTNGGNAGGDRNASALAGRAESRLTRTFANPVVTLFCAAHGGDGASATRTGEYVGGTGGEGRATTSGTNTVGSLNAESSSTGGVGGGGGGLGFAVGNRGGTGGNAISTAEAHSQLAASATSNAVGGRGGRLNNGTGFLGFTGVGGAADATSVAESQTGNATSSATATGGAGGIVGTSGPAVAGSGGVGGTARASASSAGQGTAAATASATGGTGGTGYNLTGTTGTGGQAIVESLVASAISDATATATATGGNAGPNADATTRLAHSGAGGAPVINHVEAVSTNGNATASATAIGGNAYSQLASLQGVGGDAVLLNSVTGQALSKLTLTQNARGGSGYFGGKADSRLVFTESSHAASVAIDITATGGVGAVPGSAYASGDIATTSATIFNATATTADAGRATAVASGSGTSGIVTATAKKVLGGSANTAFALSSKTTFQSEKASVVADIVGSFQTPLNSAANASSIAGTLLTGTTNVAQLLDDNPLVKTQVGGANLLELVTVHAFRATTDAPNRQYTFQSSLDISALPKVGYIVVGLFDASGDSLGEISIVASVPGSQAVFAAYDVPTALSGMSDNALLLPLAATPPSQFLTIDATITTSDAPGDFQFSIIAAQVVPEPASTMFIAFGCVFIFGRNFRRTWTGR